MVCYHDETKRPRTPMMLCFNGTGMSSLLYYYYYYHYTHERYSGEMQNGFQTTSENLSHILSIVIIANILPWFVFIFNVRVYDKSFGLRG